MNRSFPDVLGPFQQLTPEDLKNIEDNENGACALHGTLFLDEDLGWCMVSGWGVECGLPIVYYSPVSPANTVKTIRLKNTMDKQFTDSTPALNVQVF